MAKITRAFMANGDRYIFDFGACNYKKGWAQLDTEQDAPWYGHWINPITLKMCSYVEGDVYVTECEDEADFVREVCDCVRWHRAAHTFRGIDPMCSGEITGAFHRLGLSSLLH